MNRRHFLKLTGGALTVAASNLSGMNPSTDRPNFLFILSDDHGIMDAGCYGNLVINTPNIDMLASEGLLFRQAFTPAAMCAPSRSSLFTGLNPHRHGCYMNHGSVKEDVQSIPNFLGELGYRVGLAGKRHIKPEKAFPFEYMTLSLDAIEEFINRSTEEPFCLFVATNDPHAEKIGSRRGFRPSSLYDEQEIPLPPYLVDTAETREQRAGYYDLVTRLDSLVGDISTLLENLNLAENTLLTYASDHGASFPFEKWTCYEAGLNLPMIMRWPGVIEPGTQTSARVSFIDVVPTFIDLAGGEPSEYDFDGKSFQSVILDNSTKHHEY
ncbi:MAG: sulfatase-like hydrolase/transferase, partial [Candidatus Marinimicrobia bacterium]|nr:sulfatase-like hydrolase/transferase [Candidatus Neomarinimicrobiota bacterium]